jgi:hypothetical protein
MILSATLSFSQPSAEPPAGTRIKLSLGQLFIPDGCQSAEGRFTLQIHLHGAASVMEQNLIRSGWKAVQVSITLNGLSGVYTEKFAKPEVFRNLLEEVAQKLKGAGLGETPKIEKLYLSSFSAGFGGVRELLQHDEFFQRIDGLIMADSIYAGYAGDPAEHKVDPAAMRGFLRFAKEAAAGNKTFIISHCDLQPGTYASTAETADYLLNQLSAKRESVQETWTEGWQLTSRSVTKNFHVYGFAGEMGEDHMKHLRNLWLLMRKIDR